MGLTEVLYFKSPRMRKSPNLLGKKHFDNQNVTVVYNFPDPTRPEKWGAVRLVPDRRSIPRVATSAATVRDRGPGPLREMREAAVHRRNIHRGKIVGVGPGLPPNMGPARAAPSISLVAGGVVQSHHRLDLHILPRVLDPRVRKRNRRQGGRRQKYRNRRIRR